MLDHPCKQLLKQYIHSYPLYIWRPSPPSKTWAVVTWEPLNMVCFEFIALRLKFMENNCSASTKQPQSKNKRQRVRVISNNKELRLFYTNQWFSLVLSIRGVRVQKICVHIKPILWKLKIAHVKNNISTIPIFHQIKKTLIINKTTIISKSLRCN